MKTTRILILLLLATASVCRAQSIAETITPEIQALARGLENDPVRISTTSTITFGTCFILARRRERN